MKVRETEDHAPKARPWYREPESFIAITALIVSLSTVVVSLYEAALQRRHDRAEVWPNLEVATFTTPSGADVYLSNTGIGPGIVKEIVVYVDGRAMANWDSVVATLTHRVPPQFSRSTALYHGVRPGDRLTLADLPLAALPANFWDAARRVTVTICYRSVFDESFSVTDRLGGEPQWATVKACPSQPRGVDF